MALGMIRIRTHKPTNQRIINPPIHVDDPHLINMLMHGEATVDVGAGDGIQGVGCTGDESPLAPWVIGQSLNHGSCGVGDGDDAAQLVVVQVAAAVGGGGVMPVGSCGSAMRAACCVARMVCMAKVMPPACR